MRKLKLNHSRKRSHATANVFCDITDKLYQEKQIDISLGFEFSVVVKEKYIGDSNL